MNQEQINKISQSFNNINAALNKSNQKGVFSLPESHSIQESLLVVKSVIEQVLNISKPKPGNKTVNTLETINEVDETLNN